MADGVVAENRKARHDYVLFDKFEAGIRLKGSEVKSIRESRVNLSDSYVRVSGGEVFVVNLNIAPYSYAHHFLPEPVRTRKLLLKKREIEELTPTEFELLATLARQPGRVFTRAQILDAIHGVAFESYERAIDAHIKNIRRKIEVKASEPKYILTVYGVGYKFADK